jgi:glycosyltransferase involved in cell wall biosynthesis
MNAHSQTVCLNMIVRDESAVIRRCLESVRPFIDCWVVVDTGSGDSTQRVVREILEGLPGELYERPWKNFAHNRNEALALARARADYLLFIDADEVLEAEDDFKWPRLTADSFSFQVQVDGCFYPRTQLVRTALPWCYEGVLHEYIKCDRAHTAQAMRGIVCTAFHDGARGRDPATYKRDALLLEGALVDKPDNPRYTFYLAQSYRDAGEIDLALRYYRRRVELGGWEEEIWYSMHQIARLLERGHCEWPEAMEQYLRAWQYCPSRAEPLFRIALHYQVSEQYQTSHLFLAQGIHVPPPAVHHLFVERALYDYQLLFEYAVTCYYIARHSDAIEANNRLLRSGKLPAQFVEQVIRNRRFSVDALSCSGHTLRESESMHLFVNSSGDRLSLDDCIESLGQQRDAKFAVTVLINEPEPTSRSHTPLPRTGLPVKFVATSEHPLVWVARWASGEMEPDDLVILLPPGTRLGGPEATARLHSLFRDPMCWLAYGQYRTASGRLGCAEPAPSEARFLESAAQLAGASLIAVRAKVLRPFSAGPPPHSYDVLFRAAGFAHTRFFDEILTLEDSASAAPHQVPSCTKQTRSDVNKAAALVSCLMVTFDRLWLAKLAIRSYAEQTYPSRELVIVTDGEEWFRSALERYVGLTGIPGVRIVYPGAAGLTLGALRNASIRAARGEYICQWDDDDYSHPERLQTQLQHMLALNAGASFLTDHLQFIEPERVLSWIDWTGEGEYDGVARLAPGTLMMRRDLRFRYPESGPSARKGEDCAFMEAVYSALPVAALNGAGYLYLYRYHGRNTFSREHHFRLCAARSHSNAYLVRNGASLQQAIRYYPISRPCMVVGREGPVLALN